MNAAQFPNKKARIVYSADGTASFSEFCMETTDPQEIKAILEDNVDDMAAGGVDALSLVVWCRFIATLGVSTVAPDPNPWDRAYVILSEAGIDPTDVLVNRCHQNGIDFLAGFRMNDRHATVHPSGQFINEHPALQILALSFLILISVMLMLEALHVHVPKGYIYFSVFFSLVVEIINMRVRKSKKIKPVELKKHYRE